jgi:hypothetical protein
MTLNHKFHFFVRFVAFIDRIASHRTGTKTDLLRGPHPYCSKQWGVIELSRLVVIYFIKYEYIIMTVIYRFGETPRLCLFSPRLLELLYVRRSDH